MVVKILLKQGTAFPGGVAQSVEQGTHKPCVTGSIPVAATIALDLQTGRGLFVAICVPPFDLDVVALPC